MKKNALVYIKGLTEREAKSDIKNIERYCSEHKLDIVEIIFDETKSNEKDYDCLKILYKHMKSGEISTILLDSCYFYYPLATFASTVSHLADIEIINFFNGELQNTNGKEKVGNFISVNQSTIDKYLTADFGNWINKLVKDKRNILYTNREYNIKLNEVAEKRINNSIKNHRKNKGVLGIVFNESNFDNMCMDVKQEVFRDKSKFSHVIVYGDENISNLLESNKYYKIICDEFINDDIYDTRDFVISCRENSIEVIFWEGELSTNEKYDLETLLNALTYNI